jgi:hypothetical protein
MTAAIQQGARRPVQLPRLPVPPLDRTMERYLKSIEPFLLEEAARGGASFEDAYAKRAALVNAFASESGSGPKLQASLVGPLLLPL